jgi:hypothetical protein
MGPSNRSLAAAGFALAVLAAGCAEAPVSPKSTADTYCPDAGMVVNMWSGSPTRHAGSLSADQPYICLRQTGGNPSEHLFQVLDRAPERSRRNRDVARAEQDIVAGLRDFWPLRLDGPPAEFTYADRAANGTTSLRSERWEVIGQENVGNSSPDAPCVSRADLAASGQAAPALPSRCAFVVQRRRTTMFDNGEEFVWLYWFDSGTRALLRMAMTPVRGNQPATAPSAEVTFRSREMQGLSQPTR